MQSATEEAAAFIAWYDKTVPAIRYDNQALAVINRLRSDLEAANAKLARVEACSMSYEAPFESTDELDWYGWRREMKRLRAELEAANAKIAAHAEHSCTNPLCDCTSAQLHRANAKLARVEALLVIGDDGSVEGTPYIHIETVREALYDPSDDEPSLSHRSGV